MAEASVGAGTVGKFLGNTVSEAAAFAAGVAIGPLLRPVVQALENESWSLHPDKPLEPGDVAELVAQNLLGLPAGATEASLTGLSKTMFGLVVQGTMVAPDVSETLELWRRGKITEAQVDRALHKAKLLPEYWEAVKELYNERLGPAVIAVAIQRGIMRDPGFLPVGPPAATGKVPAFPVSDLDALEEALGSGIDRDRLFIETAIVGQPASPDLAARMTFRNIIEKVDFDRAISEGNTRNEWADFLFDGFRQILTAHDGIEDHLRGWSDQEAMYAQTARHGMSREDTDVLFRITGRPLSWHQVFIGLRRGGTYDGPTDDIDPAFLKALRESNIRPEWYNLAWAQRYNYPAAFVLRKLATDGDITEAETEKILLYEGWEPGLAAKVAAKWSGGTTATPTARALTDAEIRRAWYKQTITRPDALARLERHGYTPADAEIYLENTTKAPTA